MIQYRLFIGESRDSLFIKDYWFDSVEAARREIPKGTQVWIINAYLDLGFEEHFLYSVCEEGIR